jgi:hypothetical protein
LHEAKEGSAVDARDWASVDCGHTAARRTTAPAAAEGRNFSAGVVWDAKAPAIGLSLLFETECLRSQLQAGWYDGCPAVLTERIMILEQRVNQAGVHHI